jgi:hypothetical protein
MLFNEHLRYSLDACWNALRPNERRPVADGGCEKTMTIHHADLDLAYFLTCASELNCNACILIQNTKPTILSESRRVLQQNAWQLCVQLHALIFSLCCEDDEDEKHLFQRRPRKT